MALGAIFGSITPNAAKNPEFGLVLVPNQTLRGDAGHQLIIVMDTPAPVIRSAKASVCCSSSGLAGVRRGLSAMPVGLGGGGQHWNGMSITPRQKREPFIIAQHGCKGALL